MSPFLVYPESHVGSHDEPLESDAPHALAPPPPMPPLSGATTTHGSGSHVATDVKVPARQDMTPFLVYPESHVGEHDEPLESDAPQALAPPPPPAPFAGATKGQSLALHTFPEQSYPASQSLFEVHCTHVLDCVHTPFVQ